MKALSVAVLLGVCCVVNADEQEAARDREYRERCKGWAEGVGWLQNYQRGDEIIKKLAKLRPGEAEKLPIDAYRDERVAFVGTGAPPGSSNDLFTFDDFYLRVVTPNGKDLRPHSVWYEVLVRGKILQVLPKNRIIVIEVDEKDWKVGDTG